MAQVGDGFSENASVAQAYANQVAYCRANDATVTARVVAAIAAQLDDPDPGAFVRRIRDWRGAPLADAVPLRSAAALHALHLGGHAPALAPIYAGEPAADAAIVAQAAHAHEVFLLPWLDGPPQTNEAGRSWGFAAAMLWLAGQGLPPRFECLEIGSSAGINLMMDRYSYDLAGVKVGPETGAVLNFAPEWHGPPPPARAIAVESLKGCDVAPLDLTDPAQAMRLRAYIWPEHAVRFARLDAAIAAAHARKPDLVRCNAADFVERELARPQRAGTTRMLMHSIVWQYLPAGQQARIAAVLAACGAAATPDRALAWVELEADRTLLAHGLRVRYWPGGEAPTTLAGAHAHGARVEWLAG